MERTASLGVLRQVVKCRACGGGQLAVFLSLGEMPLANAFVRREDRERVERRFPLEVARCLTCGLVQLTMVVRPEVLFASYLYASSASPPLLGHFRDYAAEVVARFAPAGSLVVEVGSNDGVLLRPLAERGVRALGIEPATNLAAAANVAGLETWNEFFTVEVAERVARDRGRAAAVLANNVLAHIDDLPGVVTALDAVLAEDGVFVAEVPYVLDLMEHVEYDTIYHEHLSYFSLEPLVSLFARGGLEIFDVRHIPIHGGSLRLFAGRAGHRPVTTALIAARDAERRAGLGDPALYARFAERVGESRDALRTMLADLRRSGKRVAALGATAKGNTLLNYCELGTADIAYIADSTPLKQGLLTPGTHIPVVPESTIDKDRPDRTVLLAWNYADTIVARFVQYQRAGGRFIHPIPLARVLEP